MRSAHTRSRRDRRLRRVVREVLVEDVRRIARDDYSLHERVVEAAREMVAAERERRYVHPHSEGDEGSHRRSLPAPGARAAPGRRYRPLRPAPG